MGYRKEAAKVFKTQVDDGVFEVRLDGSIWRLRSVHPSETLPRRADRACSDGYRRCTCRVDGRTINALAHRVVHLHFNGGLRRDRVVNHMNGNRSDNRPGNLEACSMSANTVHAVQVLGRQLGRRGTDNMHAKLTEGGVSFIKHRLANGEATDTIATAYGIGLRQIQRIAKGQAWKHIT